MRTFRSFALAALLMLCAGLGLLLYPPASPATPAAPTASVSLAPTASAPPAPPDSAPPAPTAPAAQVTDPVADPAPPDLWPGTGAWASEQLAGLSLEEKVSQLFFVQTLGTYASVDDPSYERLVQLVEDFGVGGVIVSTSYPMEQATLLNDLQERAEVPLLISQDMEYGAGMRVEGATVFPHAMAVGAARRPDYAYAIGHVTAREARALGTQWVYAPVADVNNNPDNPIINIRSYGEDPEMVARMVISAVRGVQQGGAMATVKHFPGHGDTAIDSHLGLPVLPFSRARLDRLELVPFRRAIDAGVMSVMTGHLALPRLQPDDTLPASLSPYVTRRLLRREFDFGGLIVTDALDMGGVTQQFGPGETALRALEAGSDVLLMSEDPYAARAAILQAVENGQITEARIDRSVRRLLKAKEWLGLHRERMVDLDALRRRVGTRPHQAISETIAREAVTLLGNEGDVIPLLADSLRLLSIALDDGADPEAGAYFARQLRRRHPAAHVEARTLDRRSTDAAYRAARRAADTADVVLVPAFINVRAWSGAIDLPDRHRTFLETLIRTGKPVVLIAFGNPYLARGLDPQPAAYVAAYGSAPVMQRAVANALFGKSPISGALPVTIPDAYDYGDGLHLPQVAPRRGLAETVGMSSRRLDRADSLMQQSITQHAFPGAAVVVGRGGVIAKQEGYGYFTYDAEQPVTPQSRFDMASLTKVIVTTTAVMQLYEADLLDLDAPVARYLPAFAQNGKGGVTIRHLLTHSAGLIPFRRYYAMPDVKTRADVVEAVMAAELQYEPGTETAYSDLGFITLMLVIEQITGQDFASYAEAHIFEPLGMDDTGFRPLGADLAVPDSAVVPTERDTVFRHRLVQGAVHDENAYLMGGVSGHAGLFSTAEDLARFGYMLVHDGWINGRRFLQPETIRLFTTRAEDLGEAGSTRALGWDTRSMEGYSSAGSHFGANSFGHTGFTGTSFWVDPDQDLFVILLTNRVYPTRENRKHIAVRARLADIAYTAIQGPPRLLMPRPETATSEASGGT